MNLMFFTTSFQDIFKSGFLDSVNSFSLTDTALALLFAFALGMLIVLVYRKTFTGVMYSDSFAASLLGLCMVTTLVILAVTSNVVLSLGMVGALSIVRFRSAIKDPMEIVFLFWSLAAGIVVGAGMILLALLGSVVIGLLLYIVMNRKCKDTPYILVLNCTDEAAEKSGEELIAKACPRYAVKAKTVRADGIELTMEVRLQEQGTAFVNELQRVEGISSAMLVSYNGEYMS